MWLCPTHPLESPAPGMPPRATVDDWSVCRRAHAPTYRVPRRQANWRVLNPPISDGSPRPRDRWGSPPLLSTEAPRARNPANWPASAPVTSSIGEPPPSPSTSPACHRLPSLGGPAGQDSSQLACVCPRKSSAGELASLPSLRTLHGHRTNWLTYLTRRYGPEARHPASPLQAPGAAGSIDGEV